MDRLKELINRYQQSVDYLAENWNITTMHMEMGELREYKEHCQIEDDTLTYLKELQHYKALEEQGRLIDMDKIDFRCSYPSDCMANTEDCKQCDYYVCEFKYIAEARLKEGVE